MPRASNEVRAYFAKPAKICARLTVGTTGAVESFYGYGIESCTRDGQGIYTLVLEEPHAMLVGASIMEVGTLVDLTYMITAEDVDNATKASRVITVTCKAAATATDPASGSVILFEFMFADSPQLGVGVDRA